MKNLKKVLALVLAFACAFTMFAGAAFTDQADIEHSDAVDMLNSLGVIGGYPDGSFHPEKTITRAEMAKMIFTIRNGGSTDASAYTDVATTFTDIDGHWAAGYIKYCQINGIISGKSSYIFDPEGEVTVVETAKMALVLMGYKADANRANLVGAGWESRVLSLATDNDLLDGVVGSVTAPIVRDEAAQLLYNTIDANCVLWSNDKEQFVLDTSSDTSSGSAVTALTVGKKYLGLKEWIGTFEGNDKNVAGLKEGYIAVDGALNGNLANNNNNNQPVQATFENDFDIKYIGEEVSVLFKDGKGGTENRPDDKDTIYGIYVTGDTTVYNITKADLQDADANKIKFGDKNYKAATNIDVYTNLSGNAVQKNYQDFDANGAYNKKCADTIKFIAKDGEITTAYITEYTLAKVTGVSSDKISLSGIGSKKFEDHEIESGLQKDDVVVVSKLYAGDDETYFVNKADVISGQLTAYNVGQSNVSIDGTKYDADNNGHFTALSDSDFTSALTDLSSSDLNETYEAYVVNGIVLALKKTSDSVDNYALIDSVAGSGTKVDPRKAYMILADGTKKTFTIASDSTLQPVDTNAPYLVKYTTNSDGELKLTDVGTPMTKANYDKDTKQLLDDTNAKGVVATDCVLFVKTAADKYSVYTDVRSLGDINASKSAMAGLFKADNDGKIVAAYIELMSKPNGASSDTMYGIVTSEGTVSKVDDTSYISFSVYANGQEMTIKFEGDEDTYTLSGNQKLAKGDLVYFDKTADDVYSVGDVKKTTDNAPATGQNIQVKEYDASGKILTYSTTATNTSGTVTWGTTTTIAVDDDVVITYVHTDGDKAGEDIGVMQADTTKVVSGGNTIVANARIITKDSKVIAIYVDDDYDITK